jgi:alpha-methylacyl-CoA racemase
MLAALVERGRSGLGQVIDAAIVDGTSSLAHAIWSLRGAGWWVGERGTNRLASGRPLGWPVLRKAFTEAFASRTRAEWTAVFADVDACVAPELSFAEAAAHPHMAARRTVVEIDGVPQPRARAPLLADRTGRPADPPTRARRPGRCPGGLGRVRRPHGYRRRLLRGRRDQGG